MKRQARLQDNDPLNPTDKVLDTLGGVSNISSQQDISTAISQDVSIPAKEDIKPTRYKPRDKIRKVTFQIRDSVMDQLKDVHRSLEKELRDLDAPDREVIVEEAIVLALKQLKAQTKDEFKVSLSQRQALRRKELSSGLLEKIDSKTKK